MWSSKKSTSQGGVLRNITKFVFASLVAILLWTLFINPATSHAAPATWEDGSIVYDDTKFKPSGTAKDGQPPGIPDGSKLYINIEGTQATIIYMTPEADIVEAETAQIATYSFNSQTQEYSNRQQQSEIELTPLSEVEAEYTSCGIDESGWLLCPLTNTLAKTMDYLFETITGFLKVQPIILNDTNNNLFRAWDAMRQIANVGFTIVFLIIIYSQLTSVGMSSYGIKKTLPTLIVSAILVNISYVIAAVGVDLSNIMGYALQDFFLTLRKDILPNLRGAGNGVTLVTWTNMAETILAGSAVGLAGMGLLASTGGSIAAALWLLLPILLSLILAAVVVIAIFAARQALIIVLIIISPLAFIARVLPNTEVLYKKWFSTFMTMLIFFPAISILFGGSQLAGSLIIQSADSLNTALIGMAVQVAPLVLAPFVLKFSGGALGKVGNIINDPSKGLIDRTRNATKSRAENAKANSLAGYNWRGKKINPNRITPLRSAARRLDHSNRRRADNISNMEKLADADYKSSHKYTKLHEKSHEAEQELKYTESTLDRNLKKKIQSNSAMLEKDMAVRLASQQSELQNLRLESTYEKLAAAPNRAPTPSLSRIAAESEEAARDISLTSMAKQNSQRVQHGAVSNALLQNTDTIDGQSLRDYAAGADTEHGADSALASAVSIQNENDAKLANERAQLIGQFNLNGSERQSLALGGKISATAVDSQGRTYSYDFNAATDSYLRSAAVKAQLTKGAATERLEIIESSGISPDGVKGVNYDMRGEISDLIASSGTPNQVAWMGGVSMDKVMRGEVYNDHSLKQLAFEHIKGGKFKVEQWYQNDPASIQTAIDVIQNSKKYAKTNEDMDKFKTGAQKLQLAMVNTYNNSNITSRSAESTLEKIKEIIDLDLS